MGVQKKNNKALRFNGFTDGLVVPTGAFKETGVELTRPSYSKGALNKKSTATKTGRLHIANETNPLNGLFGPFTLDAYVVPDCGGTIFFKEGSYKLEVGSPFLHFQDRFDLGETEGTIKFTIFTSDRQYTIESNFSLHRGINGGSITSKRYPNQLVKPQDTGINFNGLYLITAQFTGVGMKLFLNTQLVAEMSFGGDTKVIDGRSSDLFIGGRGGEYRGVIESVRINRGVTDPKLGMLLRNDSTIGLWTFDDEDIMEDVYFFGNKHPGGVSQGEDGLPGDGGLFDIPMVLTGIDFGNLGTTNSQSIGMFKIRDRVGDTNAGIEKLLSILTGVPLKEIEQQAWWQQGSLLFTTQEAPDAISNVISDHSALSGAAYEVPIAKRNLIINHSGTHPATGQVNAPKTGTRFPYLGPLDALATLSNKFISANLDVDLDPMVNPIERVKLLGLLIDAERNVYCLCASIIGLNNEDATSSPFGIGGVENAMGNQGFRYHHADNTPVWIVAGTSDLNIDEGNKKTNTTANPNQVTRAKDTWTRANFTRGNRFVDSSGNNNDAYFISPQSRIPKSASNILTPKPITLSATTTSVFTPTDPPTGDLLYWHHAGVGPVSGPVTEFKDLSGNKHVFYKAGGGQFTRNAADADFAGLASYQVAGSTTDGMGIVNINTDDGEGIRINMPLLDTPAIHSGGFTVFIFMRPVYTGTNNFNIFTHKGVKDYELFTSPSLNTSFTFDGVTIGPRPSSPPVAPALYAFKVSEPESLPNNIICKEFERGVPPLTGAISGAAPGTAADISWASNTGITTIFGKCTAVDTALKTATTFTNGYQDGFKWSEILIYNGAMDEVEMLDINGYFMEKYGFI